MKTINFLIFASAFLVSITIKGQSIDTASTWRVNSSIWEPGMEIRSNFYKDYIDGDTIINLQQYLKVYQSGYQYIDWIPNPYYNYFQHALHGLLRNENGKWYTYDGNQEKLLFDFTLTVNDTVFSAFTIPLNGPIIITAIDSILIDSVYKKRFHLNIEFGAEYIIEDIGATTGLFENMEFFEWDSKLVCFAKNGISLWADTTLECNLNVSVPETKINIEPFTVYPNPAHDVLNINLNNFSLSHTVAFELLNLNGTKILATKLESTVTAVLLTNLCPGFYIYKIREESKVHIGKLIKL